MRIAGTIDEARAAVADARRRGAKIVFVPTMGALHSGHLSLVRAGRERVGEAFVVLSVFVNPAQFGPHEDFDAYPRDLPTDAALAEEAGVDLLFAPPVREMYPEPPRVRVEVTGLSDPLCGRKRPGHFAGVALVVTKLMNIVRPDVTVFGQKDGQQSVVVQRLARELHLPGEIHIAPTVREADGLAISSRNRYLSPDDRRAATALSRGLLSARDAWERGERDPRALVEHARREIGREKRLELEYAEIVDMDDLAPWAGRGAAMLAVAARAGSARLIDNVILAPSAADRGSDA